MKLPHWLYKLLSLVTMPLRKNPAFFVFMYVLGCVCAWSTLSHARGAELYDNLYLELFLDVYVLTALLSLLPRVVMPLRMVWFCISHGSMSEFLFMS